MKKRKQWNPKSIKAAREYKGWSQIELSERLGCRNQTICEWEKGIYAPGDAYQKLLSAVFR